MDTVNAESTEPEVDLESGGTASKDERPKNASPPSSQRRKCLKRALGGALRFDGSSKSESGACVCSDSFRHGKDVEGSLSVLVDRNLKENDKENVPFLEKMYVQEKHPLTNSRKAPKPPRPPKGPLLDIADQKLVKDIAEVAMKKRLRIERMKALKKAKAAASSRSSSTSSIAAMLITVLFFFVIVFQGINLRSDPRLQGSPESDVPMSESMISVHHFDNLSSN
ncbi:uncharacterized protein LOC116187446 [Punica granatum]|uniref:Uncharacterized protein LOC116187446 n=1 Tax=Punica granatum TaxID=22663 RepID=A0A6P8BN22_PUNGR|nr:uncharacterized protein LOC116187446 [Punica granatum]